MSFKYHASHRDQNEPAIIEALEKAGAQVWRKLPVDLLYKFRGRWGVMEVKDPAKMNRKDQPDQDAFIAQTGCPKVSTPQEAIEAITRKSA